MGLRRWLGLPERPKGGPTSAPESATEATTRFPQVGTAYESGHDTRAAAQTTGALVVGTAERRSVEPDLPAFYRADASAAAAARPFSDAALLTKYSDYDRAALREAWALVSDRPDQLVSMFYAELFLRVREAPQMFPSHMSAQRQEFGRTLVQWVIADDPHAMTSYLGQLGADHRKFDVEPRHYEVAGAALASAWKTLAGDRWTQRHEAAVLGSYTRLASAMLDGAMKHLHEPASWGARVIGHQQILSDFAVITIQPDEPYPYKAGQYLTVELASHRRVWRQMSIASAPRRDNSFDIHVRAVGGLGVSAALVRNTRVGDRLRLGPPRGNDLVVEPGTLSSGLLCIASGTGAAPISAVVESVLAWPQPPARLEVFVGGRTRDDVYPAESISRLIAVRGGSTSASVHPVVSDDPGFGGYRGRVETVVPRLRDWAGLGVDVLVAGPNPMIEATVSNLTRNRVPLAKIHFDQYEASAA